MTRNRYKETDVRTDGHIILTGSQCKDKYILMLDPTLEIIYTACVNDCQKVMRMIKKRYRDKDVYPDSHIILNVSQCRDKCIVMLDPTLDIITNANIAKVPQTIGHTDEYIILPLRGFDPVAYSCMPW